MAVVSVAKHVTTARVGFPLYQAKRYRYSGLFIPVLKNAVKMVGRTRRTPFWDMRGKAPHLADSLQQKFARRAEAVKVPDSLRIDIGLPNIPERHSRREWKAMVRKNKQNPVIERAARLKQLKAPISEVNEEWLRSREGVIQVSQIAEHFGIYSSLFGIKAYFYAVVRLQVSFPINDDAEQEVAPVYFGNLVMPEETKKRPIVEYTSDDDNALWTLMLTNLDGHLLEAEKEYLHWLVVNIPGNDVGKGQEVCSYLPSFPPKGSGYHRMVFLLFRQEKELSGMDAMFDNPCVSLEQRTFNTKEFYSQHEDTITPAGLSFYQTKWDDSVTEVYHDTLDMREPVYDYVHKPTYIEKQRFHPKFNELLSFNLYMDQYRDPKEMKKEILVKRLKKISPFKPEEKKCQYPGIFRLDMRWPSWYREEVKKERQGFGIYKGLEDPFALDEDWEVTHHHPHLYNYVKPWEWAEKYKVPEIWQPEHKKKNTWDDEA